MRSAHACGVSQVENWRAEFTKWLRLSLSPHAGPSDRKVLVANSSHSSAHTASAIWKPSKKEKADAKSEPKEPKAAKMGGAEAAVAEFVALKAPVLVIRWVCLQAHLLACSTAFSSFPNVTLLSTRLDSIVFCCS